MFEGITVGMDMGEKKNRVCVLDREGAVRTRASIVNTAQGIRKYFQKLERCRVVIEAGTHSRWVSRILEELGHEVLVGNPRKLRMIWHSHEKSDDRDAEMLARIGRLDPELLYPIHHRGPQADFSMQCKGLSSPAGRRDARGVGACVRTCEEDDRRIDGADSPL